LSHVHKVFHRNAEFRRLPRQIHLQEDGNPTVRLTGKAIEPLRKPHAIERMNQMKKPHGLARLIGLQMSHQMPGDRFRDVCDLLLRLLDAVLAKVRESGSDRRANAFGIHSFGHRHQRDLFR